jgi:hypothetical protein
VHDPNLGVDRPVQQQAGFAGVRGIDAPDLEPVDAIGLQGVAPGAGRDLICAALLAMIGRD